ncbi:MAG TPA: hypothetical protein VH593_06470 [Ktedonobacteraceae bacterium]|jgi:hypothetical protein
MSQLPTTEQQNTTEHFTPEEAAQTIAAMREIFAAKPSYVEEQAKLFASEPLSAPLTGRREAQ